MPEPGEPTKRIWLGVLEGGPGGVKVVDRVDGLDGWTGSGRDQDGQGRAGSKWIGQDGQGRIRINRTGADIQSLTRSTAQKGGPLQTPLERRSRIRGSSGPRTGIIGRGIVDVIRWLEGADVFPWCLV